MFSLRGSRSSSHPRLNHCEAEGKVSPYIPRPSGLWRFPSLNLTFIYETTQFLAQWEHHKLLWDKSVDTLHKDRARHTQKLLP